MRTEDRKHRVKIEFDHDFAPKVSLICPDGCKGDEEGGCQAVAWASETGNESLIGEIECPVAIEWPPTEDSPTFHLADSPAVGDADRLVEALEEAWLHGFVSSGEGFNGEYPFDGDVDAARVDSANEQGARDYARHALADFKEKKKGSE